MRVKVVRGEGTKPPSVGIWWTGGDMEVVARGAAEHVSKLQPPYDGHGPGREYARELESWRDWEYERWFKSTWGEPYDYNQIFWGVVLDPEPEMNEFGEVCP